MEKEIRELKAQVADREKVAMAWRAKIKGTKPARPANWGPEA